jgi:hypothetical protein
MGYAADPMMGGMPSPAPLACTHGCTHADARTIAGGAAATA